MKKIQSILIVAFLGTILISCKNEVEGILIADNLYIGQSFSENRKLRQLIKQTLNKNDKALSDLNNFWCGGGAGCYDLGFIITQIIYKIGEYEFVEMVKEINREEFSNLRLLICAGLEYGDNDKNGEMDNKRIETEFPNLNLILNAEKEHE